MAELKGYQRTYLRGLAHGYKPVVQIGENGINDGVIENTKEQLLAHELIKVRMRRPEDKKGLANTLAEKTGAELCGIVGHTIILYKRHPEKPKIHVPQRKGDD